MSVVVILRHRVLSCTTCAVSVWASRERIVFVSRTRRPDSCGAVAASVHPSCCSRCTPSPAPRTTQPLYLPTIPTTHPPVLINCPACWRSIPVVTTAIRLIFDGRSTVCQRSLRSQWRNRIAAYSFISARQHAVNCLAIPSFCAVVLYLNIYLVTASP